MNGEKPDDDARHVVTCAYCGTQTALSLKQLESDRPVKCPACGAPLKVVPPKKKKKPFDDYYAFLAERHAYKSRTEGESNRARYVVGIIIGALYTTIMILAMVLDSC